MADYTITLDSVEESALQEATRIYNSVNSTSLTDSEFLGRLVGNNMGSLALQNDNRRKGKVARAFETADENKRKSVERELGV